MRDCDSCQVLKDRDSILLDREEDTYLLMYILSAIKLKIPFSKELLKRLEDRVED